MDEPWTVVQISKALHVRAKAEARRQRVYISRLIDEAVREYLVNHGEEADHVATSDARQAQSGPAVR